MINDQDFLHGAAFLRLINYGFRISLTHASAIHQSIYLVESDRSKSAILFKVSKKATSAWILYLASQEKSALATLYDRF